MFIAHLDIIFCGAFKSFVLFSIGFYWISLFGLQEPLIYCDVDSTKNLSIVLSTALLVSTFSKILQHKVEQKDTIRLEALG